MHDDVSQWKIAVVPRDMADPFKLSLFHENFVTQDLSFILHVISVGVLMVTP